MTKIVQIVHGQEDEKELNVAENDQDRNEQVMKLLMCKVYTLCIALHHILVHLKIYLTCNQVTTASPVLSKKLQESMMSGEWLTDEHISAAQRLLKISSHMLEDCNHLCWLKQMDLNQFHHQEYKFTIANITGSLLAASENM